MQWPGVHRTVSLFYVHSNDENSINNTIQGNLQGADGPAEPGPLPSLQHQAAADPGPRHTETPHPLLHDHPRLRLARHRGLFISHSGNQYLFRNKYFKSLFQNYLNESLKFLDKSFPAGSLGLTSHQIDSKPHIDSKILLSHTLEKKWIQYRQLCVLSKVIINDTYIIDTVKRKCTKCWSLRRGRQGGVTLPVPVQPGPHHLTSAQHSIHTVSTAQYCQAATLYQ